VLRNRSIHWQIAIFCLAILGGFQTRSALACDVCAVYTIEELGELRLGPRIAVSEQFTSFGTVMDAGEKVPNPAGEFLDSSITQVVAGWRFTDWIDAQIALPILHRSWRRRFDGAIQEESKTGIGDISILGRIRALSWQNERGLLRLSGFGGITAPTGSTRFLAEELPKNEVEEEFSFERPSHAGAPHSLDPENSSAIHGHDLAFGTGNVNGIIGAEFFGTWDRFLAGANIQYTLYTKGAYQYQFANELSFGTSLGYYLWLENNGAIALQAIFGGDSKGQDTQAGNRLSDTAFTYLYAGPGLIGRIGSQFGLEIQGEIPVVRHETSLQIVPDWRMRAAISWKF
jgi:hypothetical protein